MKRYFTNISMGIWTILVGMWITLKHLPTHAVTVQYPDERLPIPERARNRLYVNIDDCIGCDQCSTICPVDCIFIEKFKAAPTDNLGTTSGGRKKRLYVSRFDIDVAKCCFCGLCTYPCPTNCIVMTNVFEYSEYDRTNLIYQFSTMTSFEIDQAKARSVKAEKAAAQSQNRTQQL